MSLFKQLSAVSRALLRKGKAEQELDDELREYLAQNVAGKMEAGMSAEKSLRAARMEMGSLDAVKEQVHAAGWESRVENVMRDLRFGLRTPHAEPFQADRFMPVAHWQRLQLDLTLALV